MTKIAYIPIGLGGKAGVLRVQVVPGNVPCLIPAYLLTQIGAVLDMTNLLAIYTRLHTFQYMSRRLSGHVEVSLCEFGNQWTVPATYSFLKSEVWGEGPLPNSPTGLKVAGISPSCPNP